MPRGVSVITQHGAQHNNSPSFNCPRELTVRDPSRACLRGHVLHAGERLVERDEQARLDVRGLIDEASTLRRQREGRGGWRAQGEG